MEKAQTCSEWIADVQHSSIAGPPLGLAWHQLGHRCGKPAAFSVTHPIIGTPSTSYVCEEHLKGRVERIQQDGKTPTIDTVHAG